MRAHVRRGTQGSDAPSDGAAMVARPGHATKYSPVRRVAIGERACYADGAAVDSIPEPFGAQMAQTPLLTRVGTCETHAPSRALDI